MHISHTYNTKDEDIDGTSFLDLTESDVKQICGKIGPTKKICRLINEVYDYSLVCFMS